MAGDGAAEAAHGEQTIPYEWGVASYGDSRFVVRDKPEGMAELYRVVKQSVHPRAAVRVDAVIWNGHLVEPVWNANYKTVDLCHNFAGRMDSHPIDEPFDSPIFLLSKIHVATHLLDFPE